MCLGRVSCADLIPLHLLDSAKSKGHGTSVTLELHSDAFSRTTSQNRMAVSPSTLSGPRTQALNFGLQLPLSAYTDFQGTVSRLPNMASPRAPQHRTGFISGPLLHLLMRLSASHGRISPSGFEHLTHGQGPARQVV